MININTENIHDLNGHNINTEIPIVIEGENYISGAIINSNYKRAIKDTIITAAITPEKNFIVDEISVIDDFGNYLEFDAIEDNPKYKMIKFIMPNVDVMISCTINREET